ncbi:hypothetical protein CC1G_09400 [Coprinopsis cinerea okayama7|uniref:Uncharacterized protein n=1 Tax=Coprinopsis cinerea (strain Okayama-7 / 130 / ATCC MYA-4618 / FGSC 9003) TaxID=240176 RepID=A8NB40_COPC7|nr:hypothetical protein CC1G_09400 [Coprinopsis cinerea okayama7\|eukprot:XP_001832042.2 hypothetical protein CC1G_09400 [Coprinopsis cinerea okayama7\
MSSTYRAAASTKLINRLQHLYNLIREVPSWSPGDEWDRKTVDLMTASFKVSEQSIKEGFAREKYLGPAIYTWLFTHAEDYVDSPKDIPDAVFTLDHLHARLPPLLNPELRKKLEKERKESPPSNHQKPQPLLRHEPVADPPVPSSSSTGKGKGQQDPSVKVKQEKGVKEKQVALKVEKGKGVVKEDKGKGKEADGRDDTKSQEAVEGKGKSDKGKGKEPVRTKKGEEASEQRGTSSKTTTAKHVTFKPSTSNKRPPTSSSSEDDTLPVPAPNDDATVPPSKKARRGPSPDPSLSAINRESSKSDYPEVSDGDGGIEGFCPDELPTGNIRHDVAEAIRVFKLVYRKMAVVQANYDAVLAHSNQTDNDLRELQKKKIEPLLAHSEQAINDISELRKYKVDPIQLQAHDRTIQSLNESVADLTKQNAELKHQVEKLSRAFQSLSVAISNRTDLTFEPIDISNDANMQESHPSYSSVAYDPQMLAYLGSGVTQEQPTTLTSSGVQNTSSHHSTGSTSGTTTTFG